MKFLSKNMLAVLPALFLGVALYGAASSSGGAGTKVVVTVTNERSLSDAFLGAAMSCRKNCTGYQVLIGPINVNEVNSSSYPILFKYTLFKDELAGGKIATNGSFCKEVVKNEEAQHALLCKPPTTEVLYETPTIRVIKGAGEKKGADVLIVPKEHFRNMHALLGQENKASLVDEIESVAKTVAGHLVGADPTYTLMTDVGDQRQNAYHFHVRFKSDSELNEDSLQAVSPIKISVQPQQEESPVISPSRWSWGKIAVVAGCVAVAAVVIGYSVWSWRNSGKSLTKVLT